jgi:cyclic pyranopterin phosphate synthase
MAPLTHVDEKGHVRMVDVTAKQPTERVAVAQGTVVLEPATLDLILADKIKKGNVLETARIAGVMAAKQTSALIPMCHPLNISHAQIDLFPNTEASNIRIEATVRTVNATGVEMEALTAVSVAALTIYDMCKAHERGIKLTDIYLVHKAGGKSGIYQR